MNMNVAYHVQEQTRLHPFDQVPAKFRDAVVRTVVEHLLLGDDANRLMALAERLEPVKLVKKGAWQNADSGKAYMYKQGNVSLYLPTNQPLVWALVSSTHQRDVYLSAQEVLAAETQILEAVAVRPAQTKMKWYRSAYEILSLGLGLS